MHCKSSHVMLSKLKSGYLATRVSEWDGGRDETRDNGRRDKWVREKWFHVACSEKRKLDSENRASNLERTLTCSFFPHAVQNQYVSYLWWSSKVAMEDKAQSCILSKHTLSNPNWGHRKWNILYDSEMELYFFNPTLLSLSSSLASLQLSKLTADSCYMLKN